MERLSNSVFFDVLRFSPAPFPSSTTDDVARGTALFSLSSYTAASPRSPAAPWEWTNPARHFHFGHREDKPPRFWKIYRSSVPFDPSDPFDAEDTSVGPDVGSPLHETLWEETVLREIVSEGLEGLFEITGDKPAPRTKRGVHFAHSGGDELIRPGKTVGLDGGVNSDVPVTILDLFINEQKGRRKQWDRRPQPEIPVHPLPDRPAPDKKPDASFAHHESGPPVEDPWEFHHILDKHGPTEEISLSEVDLYDPLTPPEDVPPFPEVKISEVSLPEMPAQKPDDGLLASAAGAMSLMPAPLLPIAPMVTPFAVAP